MASGTKRRRNGKDLLLLLWGGNDRQKPSRRTASLLRSYRQQHNFCRLSSALDVLSFNLQKPLFIPAMIATTPAERSGRAVKSLC
ncbi:hypothetical protein KOW79_018360 [Hemibagrus wyckioides]|uniref:Uncharacterized protein n=1 Tax=Hemibagrus wyckioides TaxID=337641 RepID=A0A9D3SCI9_9TELE|nr:hypothetical protein KOW79_018360 [Hemibagrus wyckioides]